RGRSIEHSLLDAADGWKGNISKILLLHPPVGGQLFWADILRVEQSHPDHDITGKPHGACYHPQVVFPVPEDVASNQLLPYPMLDPTEDHPHKDNDNEKNGYVSWEEPKVRLPVHVLAVRLVNQPPDHDDREPLQDIQQL